MDNKIKTHEEIAEIAERLKKEKKKIVTTCGAFDLLHAGHLKSLEEAKSFGDILIVCLNSDSSIKEYKSRYRPIITQDYRAKLLAGLKCVDYIVIFNETTPINLLNIIKPDIHAKSKSGYKGVEKDVIERNGGKIVLIEDFQRFSTTNIINKIIENESRKDKAED